ncbi:hypothetical protein COV25_00175 [candidate division WWE3 bacterium CG10_big_fil_rev_8_21_14_0_10_35_32]|nr:MAG: hypothetical protein COV25_00175 [candidate division WWE3 bacterium CG10_big_fil_rev_8_21_14_0_10_35_32]
MRIPFISRVFEFVDSLGSFGVSILEYLSHRLDRGFKILYIFMLKNFELFVKVKFQTAASFIWSGGKLEKRMRWVLVLILGWFVLFAGGIFQSSLIERSDSSDFQFLTSTGSILLAQASASTQSGDKGLSDKPIDHVVKDGETLEAIGKAYGISVESIKFANNIAATKLKVGETLVIPPVEGTLHIVKKGDTIKSLSNKYNVAAQTIVDFNYIDAPYELVVGQVVTIPDAKVPVTQRYYTQADVYDTSSYGVIPYADSPTKGSGAFLWPFSGIITQGFNRYHPAIDIAANTGNIVAADKGTVIRAGWWQGGYGNAVQIDHGNGYVTTYAHMSVIAVSNGQDVSKGEKIGVVGSTGRSTGPHVHFTVQLDGKYVNPLSVL